MNLSDSDKKRHRIISAGITTLSISLLFLFFALKYIIEPDKETVSEKESAGVEVQLGSAAVSQPAAVVEKTPEVASAKEKESVKIDEQGNIEMKQKSIIEEISDKYKNQKTISGRETKQNVSADTPGTGTTTSSGDFTESKITTDKNNMVMVQLGRRKVISFPSMPTDMKEEGVVVVDIYVDKKGNVIEANPNGRGTTTASSILKLKAKQIATAIKFSEDNKIEEQKGSVKINFKFE
ncbi:MAG: hypothetical protein K0S32_2744 [Bacteroidetes bacterium]|jgi:outer membrane biosynthesis protein TonB|nr:hypothetical protein [Bacteroidota bacterium]